MPKLIILEGADCTGKTTLAKFIARRREAMYFHAIGAKTLHAGMVEYHHNILESAEVAMNVCGLDVVLDRHWPSEVIYGDVMRPGMHARINYPAQEFFAKVQKLGGQYIFCFSDNAKKNQLDRESDRYNHKDYAEIYERYEIMGRTFEEDDVRVNFYNLEDNGSDIESFCKKCKL